MADAVVVAAALVAKLEDGGERYFYQGESLSGVDDDEVQRLTEIGLVGEPDEIPDPVDPVTAPRRTRRQEETTRRSDESSSRSSESESSTASKRAATKSS